MATLKFLIDVTAPDAAKTFDAVKARLDRLDESMKRTRDLSVGDKSAMASLAKMQIAADRLRDRVTSPMDVSLRGAQGAEAKLLALEATADKLDGKLRDLGGGRGSLSRIAGAAGGAAKAGGIGAGVTALAGAAAGIASPLAAAGLAVGAFGALAVPTLSKVDAALTKTGKAGQQAWAQLDPGQRGIARSVKSLEGTFSGAAKSFEPVVASVVKLAASTAQDLLPAVSRLAPAGAKVIDAFLKPLDGLLRSTFFARFTDQMASLATQAGPLLGKTMTQLLKVFMQMFEQAGPAGLDLLKNLLPLFTDIASGLVPVVRAGAQFADWLSRMAARSPAVATALLAVGAAIAVATGGLTVIIPAILALAGWLVHLWQTSEKFRDVVSTVFAVTGKAVLTFAEAFLDEMHVIADIFLGTVGIIIHGAADAFGWVPGVGGKLKTAAKAFDGFKQDVNNVFNAAHAKIEGWKTSLDRLPKTVRLKGNISDLQAKLAAARKSLADPHLTAVKRARIEANISQLKNQIQYANDLLNWINGKTAVTSVYTKYYTTPAGVKYHAAGTPSAPPGWAWVGERGPELVRFHGGETVLPHAVSLRVARGFADAARFAAGQLVGVGDRGPELAVFDRPGRILSPEQTAALYAAASRGSDGGTFTGTLYLDSGELLGIVRGEIRKNEKETIQALKSGSGSRR